MNNGRTPCEGCGSRATEVISNLRHTNYRRVECHDCGDEFKEYTGQMCGRCGSKNTKKKTEGVAPHRSTVRECRECGYRRYL